MGARFRWTPTRRKSNTARRFLFRLLFVRAFSWPLPGFRCFANIHTLFSSLSIYLPFSLSLFVSITFDTRHWCALRVSFEIVQSNVVFVYIEKSSTSRRILAKWPFNRMHWFVCFHIECDCNEIDDFAVCFEDWEWECGKRRRTAITGSTLDTGNFQTQINNAQLISHHSLRIECIFVLFVYSRSTHDLRKNFIHAKCQCQANYISDSVPSKCND